MTIIDPNAEWIVDTAKFASKGKNTHLNGATLRGRPPDYEQDYEQVG